MLGLRGRRDDRCPEHVQRKGRLAPGKMFLVDLEEGRIVEDDQIKRRSPARPYGEWYERSVVHIDDFPGGGPARPGSSRALQAARLRVLAGGPTDDHRADGGEGEEPVASMGNYAALAVMSDRQPPLFSDFKQLFAQVTNPPIDPIRENVVMSLQAGVGAEVNLLSERPVSRRTSWSMNQPILRNHELEKLRSGLP